MAHQMMIVLSNYDDRITFLRSKGDQLLQSIQSLEIGINRRKQNNEQPYQCELDLLYSMARKLLEMLAEIKTCEYFKLTHRLVFCNDELYKTTCNAILTDLINKFFNRFHQKQSKKFLSMCN